MTSRHLPAPARRLQAGWTGLQARERRLIALAGGVLGLALLWWLAIAPPLATLKTAATERTSLRAQAVHMQQLAQEARMLQSLPTLAHDEALHALEQAVKQHLPGSATLAAMGEQARLTLTGASAEALAQWLAAARSNARALPVQADLRPMPETADDAGNTVRWSGTLTLGLPP